MVVDPDADRGQSQAERDPFSPLGGSPSVRRAAWIDRDEPADGGGSVERVYLEQLFESAPEGIVLLDDEDRVIRANAEFFRIFGYSEAELAGRLINEMIVPPEWLAAAQALTQQVTGGKAINEEGIRWRKGGQRLHVSLLGCPVMMGGRQIATYAIYRDISERKLMEQRHQELLEREREARARAEAAERRAAVMAKVGVTLSGSLRYKESFADLARLLVPDLADYCLIDEALDDGSLLRVARAHRDPEREKILQNNSRHPPEVDLRRHPALRVVRTGQPLLVAEFDDQMRELISHDQRHSDELRRLELNSFIIVPLIARGRTLGVITLAAAESGRRYTEGDLAIAREVADRAAMAIDNARLYRDAQAAIGSRERMLGFVSHDLRNPLATILLNTTSILDSLGRGESAVALREQLQWIEGATGHMDRLIQDLLDVSRISAGQFALQSETLQPVVLMRSVLRTFAPQATEAGVELRLNAEPGLPSIYADCQRLLQVFSNLVGNALKFTPAGGRIDLAASRVAGEVLFSVSDTGCGIAPGNLPRLFDSFWQERPGERNGAGLGLAIAQAIVAAHGGELRAQSEPGEGSKFGFALPVHADDLIDQGAAPHPPSGG